MNEISIGEFARRSRLSLKALCENPMHTMVSGRATELQACRVRLTRGSAAMAEARGQVRAAISAWNVPADLDAAILLTNELVTNVVKHTDGTVTLGIRSARAWLAKVTGCSRGRLPGLSEITGRYLR